MSAGGIRTTRILMPHDCDVPLKEQIRDIVAHTKEAYADGRISFREATGVLSEFQHATSHVLGALANPSERAGELADAAESLFDEYLVPLDIYGVPAYIEEPAEALLRSQIRPWVLRLAGAGS